MGFEKHRFMRHFDYLIPACAALLISAGVIFIYSAAYNTVGPVYAAKQITWSFIGIVIFLIFVFIDYKALINVATILYILSIIVLGSLFFVGKQHAGACSWISVGGFTVQPSEFAKIALILILAKYLVWDNEKRNSLAYIIKTFLIASVPLFLILKQPDLGTALVFIPIILAMLYVAGARPRYLIMIISLGILAVPVLFSFLKDYQKARLLVFINPDIDPLGAGYNIIQSKIAIGSGGLFGKGWLKGTQSQLNFLPERHTDFIFSVIGEEFGLLGGTAILIIFGIMILACFKAARHSRDLSGRLIVTGVIIYISTHIIINVGMTVGIMPITGLPLPLLSYGGSSMIATMMALGIVESVYVRRYMF